METPEINYCILTADKIPESFCLDILKKLVAHEPIFGALSLVTLGRDAMRKIHQDYKGGVLSTDILTFTVEEGSGDMLLCPKNVLAYAYKNNIPFEVRWWHLVVHGLSHLKNLDHETLEDAAVFTEDEKSRWSRLALYIPHLKLWSWDDNYIYHYKGA